MRIGILSDTHGLLRKEVFPALEGVAHILHAGDVGPTAILTELEAVAPVTAVSGNTDGWDIRHRLSEVAELTLAGNSIVVLHGHRFGRSPTPEMLARAYPEADLVVYGHTHRQRVERVGPVLTVNPGSAGARRFALAPSLAIAELSEEGIEVRLVELPG